MNKITKLIVLILICIFITFVVLTEVKYRPKLSLINEVKKIIENIEELNYDGETIEILIDNEYTLDSKKYIVEGKGVIFLEKDLTIMLSRNGMCALKMPYSDEIMFQEEICPNYRLVNNEKVVID